jgi:preprotein translocase subunit SecB
MTQPVSASQPQHEFAIQRIYAKDISYESPHTPDIFSVQWTPQVELNLQTDYKKLLQSNFTIK